MYKSPLYVAAVPKMLVRVFFYLAIVITLYMYILIYVWERNGFLQFIRVKLPGMIE